MKNFFTRISNQIPITIASSLVFAAIMLLLDYVLQIRRGLQEQVFTFFFYFLFWAILDLISNVPDWNGFWTKAFGKKNKS